MELWGARDERQIVMSVSPSVWLSQTIVTVRIQRQVAAPNLQQRCDKCCDPRCVRAVHAMCSRGISVQSGVPARCPGAPLGAPRALGALLALGALCAHGVQHTRPARHRCTVCVVAQVDLRRADVLVPHEA